MHLICQMYKNIKFRILDNYFHIFETFAETLPYNTA